MSRTKPRTVHCPPDKQEAIHKRAGEADKSVSRHLIELALADDPDRHPLVLTPDEQREMRDNLRHLKGLVRALRQEIPGMNGVSLLEALALLCRVFSRCCGSTGR